MNKIKYYFILSFIIIITSSSVYSKQYKLPSNLKNKINKISKAITKTTDQKYKFNMNFENQNKNLQFIQHVEEQRSIASEQKQEEKKKSQQKIDTTTRNKVQYWDLIPKR